MTNPYLSTTMQTQIFTITQVMLIVLVFGLLSTLRFGLLRAFDRLEVKKALQKRYIGWTLAIFLIWLGILAGMAIDGRFSQLGHSPPRLLYVILPPLFCFWALIFWPPFQRILKVTPKSWLFYAQTYRIFTDLLLWLGFLAYFVPKQLTFLWLNQDYTVGLTAIVAGLIFFGRGQNRKFEGILWNIFGIILLFNQVFLGYLSLPMPEPIINSGIDSVFLTKFPFIWIWGFTIPFGFGLHLASLYQILFLKPKQHRRSFSLKRRRIEK